MKTAEQPRLVRFSVSLPQDAAEGLDRMAQERGFDNRSQCLASLIRHQLLGHAHENGDTIMMGLLSLIYDHRKPLLQQRLTELQHQFLKEIITIQLVHLEDQHTLQIILLQGPVSTLRTIADTMISLKGVRHGSLQLNSELLPPLY